VNHQVQDHAARFLEIDKPVVHRLLGLEVATGQS
jgi:hypothetical protein